MKKSINIFAAAVLVSTINFNVMAEGSKKVLAVNEILPVLVEASEISAPEPVQPLTQAVYTGAQKAAQVELDFVWQKQSVLKVKDVLVDSIPVIEVEAPEAARTFAANRVYTPAQKIALVELSF